MKRKEEGRFKRARRGYDTAEVEEYVKSQERQTEAERKALKDALDDSREENERLTAELAVYKSREEEIKTVLTAATEKANDMTADLKLQYALEIERLKLFQAKWTNSYEELKERYHFDKDALNMESVAMNAALEIERLLHKDFGIPLSPSGGEPERQFKSELERLGMPESELRNLVDAIKKELKDVS